MPFVKALLSNRCELLFW